MSRLADDIATLTRVADICGKVIYPEAQFSVPDNTLRALAAEVETARRRIAEYPLINDEATFLITAAQRIAWARADRDDVMRERWTRLGELLRAAIEVDLVNAKKSMGAS